MSFSVGKSVVVVDASAAIPFLLGDERWLQQWAAWAEADAMLLAPPHFRLEVSNVLLKRRRLSGAAVATMLGRLWGAGVEIADRGRLGLYDTVELAERLALTVYDAAYLHLAIDVDAELATLDGELRDAAIAENVALIDAKP